MPPRVGRAEAAVLHSMFRWGGGPRKERAAFGFHNAAVAAGSSVGGGEEVVSVGWKARDQCGKWEGAGGTG